MRVPCERAFLPSAVFSFQNSTATTPPPPDRGNSLTTIVNSCPALLVWRVRPIRVQASYHFLLTRIKHGVTGRFRTSQIGLGANLTRLCSFSDASTTAPRCVSCFAFAVRHVAAASDTFLRRGYFRSPGGPRLECCNVPDTQVDQTSKNVAPRDVSIERASSGTPIAHRRRTSVRYNPCAWRNSRTIDLIAWTGAFRSTSRRGG
jgi:hypothetical protein